MGAKATICAACVALLVLQLATKIGIDSSNELYEIGLTLDLAHMNSD